MVNEDRPARSAARERRRQRALRVTVSAGVMMAPIPLAANEFPDSARIPQTPATAVRPAQGAPGDGRLYARYAQDVTKLVNQQREVHGCRPLIVNQAISRAAYEHSEDMGVNGYFAHDSPSGVTPWDRMKQAGYAQPAAENIAVGYRTPQEVVDGWMNSPEHRENILDCSYKATGVGYYDVASASGLMTMDPTMIPAPNPATDAAVNPTASPAESPAAKPVKITGPWWTEDFGYA